MRRYLMRSLVIGLLVVMALPYSRVSSKPMTVTVGDTKTLIAAINTANANHQADTVIDLTPNATYSLTELDNSPVVPLQNQTTSNAGLGPDGLPVISVSLTINGNGATIKRDSATKFRILEVFGGAKLTLNDLTLTGGDVGTQSGGAIDIGSASTVILNHCVVINNESTGDGGAIANEGSLVVNGSRLEKNSAKNGGAIDTGGGPTSVTLTDSFVVDNEASTEGQGGAIYLENGTLTLTNTQIAQNGAMVGGGIFVETEGILTISHSVIAGNRSTVNPDAVGSPGGGGLSTSGEANITDSTFANNVTSFAGGAINSSGILSITNSVIANNQALVGGGILTIGDTDLAGPDRRTGKLRVTQSCIFGNHIVSPDGKQSKPDGLENKDDAPLLDATNNWWGDSTGPSGKGKGHGEGAYGNVSLSPFLTTAPAACTAGTPTPIAISNFSGTPTPEPACGTVKDDPRWLVEVTPGTVNAGVQLTCDLDNYSTSVTVTGQESSGAVVGHFNHPVKVCLQGSSGTLKFQSFAPGAALSLQTVPSTQENGYLCTKINGSGSVALFPKQ